jgi:sortase (surface protein transpeptidase)
MPARSNKKPAVKRQPAAGRLSSSASRSQPTKIWRVKKLHLWLGFSSQLVISFRRFRTNKSRRSKRFKQLVIQVSLLSIREIAVAKTKRPRQRRTADRYNRSILGVPPKAFKPLVLVLIAISTAAYFGLYLNKSTNDNLQITSVKSVSAYTPPAPKPKTLPRSEPTRLRIPSVEIDTAVESLGRQPSGEIETPIRYDIVGWYKYGPTPGELGPAVIVGHVDNWQGVAVFWRLRDLQPGDEIDVDRADGQTAKFTVTSSQQVPRDSFPTQAVYGNLDYAGIRLITCGGVFNTQTHEYTDNTVVYGKLE